MVTHNVFTSSLAFVFNNIVVFFICITILSIFFFRSSARSFHLQEIRNISVSKLNSRKSEARKSIMHILGVQDIDQKRLCLQIEFMFQLQLRVKCYAFFLRPFFSIFPNRIFVQQRKAT